MRTFYTLLLTAVALLVCVAGSPHALARASQAGHDDPWSAEHIDRLPPEIRNALIHMCGSSPQASHYFATYLDHAQLIKLHFEHLHCSEQSLFCKGVNCLHQEYMSSRGHYRLIRTYYDSGND